MLKEDFIKQFNHPKLCDSKEFKSFYPNRRLKDREIYWTWTGLIYIFDYLCPKNISNLVKRI